MSTTDLPEPLDRDSMAAAITDFIAAHDELRCWFDVDGATVVRHLAAADAVTMTPVPVGDAPSDHGRLLDYLYERMAGEAVHDRLPGLAVGAIDAGTSYGFYVIIDHSHTDGISSILALGEIFARYRAHRGGPAPELLPARSHLLHIVEESDATATLSADDPRVQRWREILRLHDRTIPRSPLDLELTGAQTAPAAVVDRPMATAEQTAAAELRAREHSGSLLGLIFAAMALAEYEMTGDPQYFVATVMSTRDKTELATQGWLCNFAPISFRVDHPDTDGPADTDDPVDMDALVAVATEAVRTAKDLNTVPVHTVLGLLAATGDVVLDDGTPQMVSYFDLRRLPGIDNPEMATGRLLPGLGRTRNANLWINRDADGLRLMSLYPDNPTAAESVGTFHQRVTEIVAGHGAES